MSEVLGKVVAEVPPVDPSLERLFMGAELARLAGTAQTKLALITAANEVREAWHEACTGLPVFSNINDTYLNMLQAPSGAQATKDTSRDNVGKESVLARQSSESGEQPAHLPWRTESRSALTLLLGGENREKVNELLIGPAVYNQHDLTHGGIALALAQNTDKYTRTLPELRTARYGAYVALANVTEIDSGFRTVEEVAAWRDREISSLPYRARAAAILMLGAIIVRRYYSCAVDNELPPESKKYAAVLVDMYQSTEDTEKIKVPKRSLTHIDRLITAGPPEQENIKVFLGSPNESEVDLGLLQEHLKWLSGVALSLLHVQKTKLTDL